MLPIIYFGVRPSICCVFRAAFLRCAASVLRGVFFVLYRFVFVYPHRRRPESVLVCLSACPRSGGFSDCPTPIPPGHRQQRQRMRAKVLNVATSCVKQSFWQTLSVSSAVRGLLSSRMIIRFVYFGILYICSSAKKLSCDVEKAVP